MSREKLSVVKAEEVLAPKKQKFYLLGSILLFVGIAACTGIVRSDQKLLNENHITVYLICITVTPAFSEKWVK